MGSPNIRANRTSGRSLIGNGSVGCGLQFGPAANNTGYRGNSGGINSQDIAGRIRLSAGGGAERNAGEKSWRRVVDAVLENSVSGAHSMDARRPLPQSGGTAVGADVSASPHLPTLGEGDHLGSRQAG